MDKLRKVLSRDENYDEDSSTGIFSVSNFVMVFTMLNIL